MEGGRSAIVSYPLIYIIYKTVNSYKSPLTARSVLHGKCNAVISRKSFPLAEIPMSLVL